MSEYLGMDEGTRALSCDWEKDFKEEEEDEEEGVTRANHAFIWESNTTFVIGRKCAWRCHATPSVSE